MPDLSRKFREVREARGLNKAEFARILDVSPTSVEKYDKGAVPGLKICLRMANELKVSMDWLLFDHGKMDAGSEELARRKMTPDEKKALLNRLLEEVILECGKVETPPDLPGIRIVSPRDFKQPHEASEFYALPLYGDVVAAGTPREVEDASAEGVAIIHKNWCPNPGASFFIRAKGDSMEPTIPDGAFVCVDAAVRDAAAVLGRIVVLAVEGAGATIKRLRKTERGDLLGIPDNLTPDNPPLTLKEGDRIVGLVRSVHAEVK